MSKRLAWLDTARFLGIFLVFMFHNGGQNGYIHAFSIQVCLHLFFLLSGFAEQMHGTYSWKEFIIKNVRKLFVPYILFATLAILLNAVQHNTYTTLILDTKCVLKGVPRGHFNALGLWFLTCLFVVRLFFFILHQYLKKTFFMFPASLILYLIGDVLGSRGYTWITYYNIDSALVFLPFYMMGYFSFNPIRSLMKSNTLLKKAILAGTAIISGTYTLVTFWGKQPLIDLCSLSPIALFLAELIHPLILCSFILILAKLIEDMVFLQVLGQETLYLCGSEYLIHTLINTTILYFGITPNHANSFSPYIYVMAMLIVGHYVFVPFEKAILKKLGC